MNPAEWGIWGSTPSTRTPQVKSLLGPELSVLLCGKLFGKQEAGLSWVCGYLAAIAVDEVLRGPPAEV